uniref:NADH-ubiquinone oxidoreductase chain 6 n=1 Tax=Anthicidae sp. DPP-2018 TaxID=2136110 RepID=A0A343YV68_9CUCU|nr:NADH dehydrogenase subunit 6 [Anthicidae sp. DPP-2018]
MHILMILNLSLSLTFLFMTHPLSMGLILLLQTLIISLITGKMFLNFWFSYIIFLILVGGMLILFIYMTSIASNEKFNLNYKMMFMIIIPLIMLNSLFMINLNFKETSLMNQNYQIHLSKYISFPSNLIMIMMIIYLLLTLIATVKIVKNNKNPLRLKY